MVWKPYQRCAALSCLNPPSLVPLLTALCTCPRSLACWLLLTCARTCVLFMHAGSFSRVPEDRFSKVAFCRSFRFAALAHSTALVAPTAHPRPRVAPGIDTALRARQVLQRLRVCRRIAGRQAQRGLRAAVQPRDCARPARPCVCARAPFSIGHATSLC